jgi:hypothetical protein
MTRLYLFLVFLILCSCGEEDFPVFALVTEDPLYVSGEQAQLVGRLITNEVLQVDDHGFWVDMDEAFSNPEIVSLGSRTEPGRFIGEVRNLLPAKAYFVKTFTQIGGNTTFGNVILINSLNPGIFSFSPQYALPGQKMEIIGLNLGAETRVFFDEAEAVIEEIVYESKLIVTIPPIRSNPSPVIKVVSNGVEMVFEDRFEYMVGQMRFIGFPEKYRLVNAVNFQSNGRFYIYSGFDSELNINQLFWEFDPLTENWQSYDFNIPPHISGFGTEGYFGGGYEAVPSGNMAIPNRSFWHWNGSELLRKADVPFTATNSISFRSKEKIYVLGGNTEGHENTLYRYDPETDSWDRLPDFNFAIQANLPYFVYEDQLYFVTERKELVRFDPESGQRQIVGTYPGSIVNGLGVGVVLEDHRAIIGLYRQEVEIWELDLQDFIWKRKINFPGIFQGNNLGFYSHNNLVYILRSTNLSIPQFGQMEFWEFDPDGF